MNPDSHPRVPGHYAPHFRLMRRDQIVSSANQDVVLRHDVNYEENRNTLGHFGFTRQKREEHESRTVAGRIVEVLRQDYIITTNNTKLYVIHS